MSNTGRHSVILVRVSNSLFSEGGGMFVIIIIIVGLFVK